jgi:hypothetical protein
MGGEEAGKGPESSFCVPKTTRRPERPNYETILKGKIEIVEVPGSALA